MGLVLLLARQGTISVKSGAVVAPLTLTTTTSGRVTGGARVALGFQLGVVVTPSSPPVPQGALYPDISYQVAFASQPLTASPTWVEVGTRLRALGSNRGRSYEFDREETGTMDAVLSNRDAALSPSNASSPYAPIKSTRPVRAFLNWNGSYPLFRGISEGFPQNYTYLGKDAHVQLRANDLFYGLNNSRFTPGSTILAGTLPALPSEPPYPVETTMSVFSTALPMPQTAPFTVTVGTEQITVTAINSAVQYAITRQPGSPEHLADVVRFPPLEEQVVHTTEVSFGEALSGERIRQVLEAVGFDSSWYDLDAGQSLIAPSGDLATVAPLEHINLIADAEFGRFFVSKAGKFTFRDRHSVILDYLTPALTFGTTVPFSLDGELEHSEAKLYNRVKITIQGGAYDGTIVDVSDQDSIDDHFERVFERTFPYANVNDADSAARFVLARNSEATLRLPGITVKPARSPATLWPQILARELGERVRFVYQPEAGGTAIDKQLIIEGISHDIKPQEHVVTFQCTEADSNQYWILGLAGYGELDTHTRVGF